MGRSRDFDFDPKIWSDRRRRRIANCQPLCELANLAMEMEKVRRVGGVRIYCEILKLHKIPQPVARVLPVRK